MARVQDAFQTYYCSQNANRKLSWQAALGFCVLRAQFDKVPYVFSYLHIPSSFPYKIPLPLNNERQGSKDLHVSLYQAAVLLLFVDKDTLNYANIKAATGIGLFVCRKCLLCMSVDVCILMAQMTLHSN